MVIALCYRKRYMTKVEIWRDCMMKHAVTKFGSLKIDNGGDAVMCSDDTA